jgi:hypothetical protein
MQKTSLTSFAISWAKEQGLFENESFTSFASSGVATLLATTVISKTHQIGLIYDEVKAQWVCMACDATGY